MITEKSASFIMYADKMVALQATIKKETRGSSIYFLISDIFFDIDIMK